MSKTTNIQDVFLNKARKTAMPLTVFLMNGFQMRGIVKGFDSYVIVFDSDGKQQIVFKHAVSTIVPAKNLPISEDGEQ